MTVKVVLKGSCGERHVTIYHDVKMVETKWIDDFNWYGRVLHLARGETATFRVPVEMYGESNIGYVRI